MTGEELTITLEGASQGDDYVEIVVPEGTTEPLSQESRKAVWTLSDLENMDEVKFETKETSPPPSSSSAGWVLPAVGVVAIAAVAVWYFMSRRS